jgi:hypothetical protein
MAQAMVTQECTSARTALSPADGRMDGLVLPHVNPPAGTCFWTNTLRAIPKTAF